MGCACEDGARDSYYAVITDVIDIARAREMIEKFAHRPWIKEIVRETKEGLDKADPDAFTVSLETRGDQTVGITSIPSTIFPQTQEWAKARIGKRIHVTMTRMAKRLGGELTMDVHDPRD